MTPPDPSASVLFPKSFEVDALKRENVAYLVGGLAFGVLLGFGIFHTFAFRPEAQIARAGAVAERIPSPAGPMAPTQMPPERVAAGAGAPMVEEVNALKRILEQDPRDAQALTRLANLYQDIGDCAQAIAYYEKALAVRPSDPNLLTDTGTCYLNVNDPEKALELFDRAHAEDPAHWQSLFNKAVVLGIHLGRADEAQTVLDEVDRIQPSVPEVARLRQFFAQSRAQRTTGS